MQVLKNSTEMYSEKDLYVGKVLSVHQRTFELLEADEFTYQYMENNRHVYLMADWEAALKAIQAQLQGQPWPNPSLPGSGCDCWCKQLCGRKLKSFCLVKACVFTCGDDVVHISTWLGMCCVPSACMYSHVWPPPCPLSTTDNSPLSVCALAMA